MRSARDEDQVSLEWSRADALRYDRALVSVYRALMELAGACMAEESAAAFRDLAHLMSAHRMQLRAALDLASERDLTEEMGDEGESNEDSPN